MQAATDFYDMNANPISFLSGFEAEQTDLAELNIRQLRDHLIMARKENERLKKQLHFAREDKQQMEKRAIQAKYELTVAQQKIVDQEQQITGLQEARDRYADKARADQIAMAEKDKALAQAGEQVKQLALRVENLKRQNHRLSQTMQSTLKSNASLRSQAQALYRQNHELKQAMMRMRKQSLKEVLSRLGEKTLLAGFVALRLLKGDRQALMLLRAEM